MSPKKANPKTASSHPTSTAMTQPPHSPAAPPPVELALSLGWLWISLSGGIVLIVSLLNHTPWLLAFARAVGVMVILGFLIWYLSDNLMRALLETRVPAQKHQAPLPEPPSSTRELNA